MVQSEETIHRVSWSHTKIHGSITIGARGTQTKMGHRQARSNLHFTIPRRHWFLAAATRTWARNHYTHGVNLRTGMMLNGYSVGFEFLCYVCICSCQKKRGIFRFWSSLSLRTYLDLHSCAYVQSAASFIQPSASLILCELKCLQN